jgi:ribosomal protein S18 acetylase RimI-like enzyme
VTGPVRVRVLDAAQAAALRPRLAGLLLDAVRHGANVGFLESLRREDAEAFWRRIERAVAARGVVLLAAELDGELVGTVQLDVDTLPNQPHRATVSKLLVHSTARRQGVGERLMRALEDEAARAGRTLLTLDTATAEADRLYRRLGFAEAGAIPGYALDPDGTPAAATFFWKALPGPAQP